MLRERVRSGQPIKYYVPDRVAGYIERHHLYAGVGSFDDASAQARDADPMTPEELAQAIVEYAADRKALDIVQLDLRGMIGYTDYFVICSGRTERQTKAIHDAIHAG